MNNLVTEYEDTEAGQFLKAIIREKIKNGEINTLEGEFVFQNAVTDYEIIFKKRKLPIKSEQLLLLACPEIFSLLDVVKINSPVRKDIFTVAEKNSEEVSEILISKNIEFLKYIRLINEINVHIFVIVKTSTTFYNFFNHDDTFGEIRRRKIPLSHFIYRLRGFPSSSFVSRDWGNSLDIDKRIIGYSSGFRKDLDFAFRSAWEANIARVLNHLEIKWEYETMCFKLNDELPYIFYIPDFILPNNVIIEVKGFWNNKSRQKVRLFRLKYPEYKLLIIDSDLYDNIDKEYRKNIPFWEITEHRLCSQIVQVVDINQPVRIPIVKSLRKGDELELIREPNNIRDSSAIIVSKHGKGQVGYISEDWDFIYSQKIDMGMKFHTVVREIKPDVIDVNIKLRGVEFEQPKFFKTENSAGKFDFE